jgi:hypothetical protein
MLHGAPDEHGVYALFDGDELIYVGAAHAGLTIKTCLLLHEEGAWGLCTGKATAYAWEITRWASARSTEILAAFCKLHLDDPRCQSKVA